MTRMTPKTSESPDAIRNRALVSPLIIGPKTDAADTVFQPPEAAALSTARITPLIHRRLRLRIVIDRILDDGERIGRVLDHDAPELAHFGLVGLRMEGALADRRVDREPQKGMGDLVLVDAARLLDRLGKRDNRDIAHDRPARAVLGMGEGPQMALERLVRRRFARTPDHRIVGVGPDAVRIGGAKRHRLVDGADLAAVRKTVVDRLEITERRRLLDERDEIAGKQGAIYRIRLFPHLRGDERRSRIRRASAI